MQRQIATNKMSEDKLHERAESWRLKYEKCRERVLLLESRVISAPALPSSTRPLSSRPRAPTPPPALPAAAQKYSQWTKAMDKVPAEVGNVCAGGEGGSSSKLHQLLEASATLDRRAQTVGAFSVDQSNLLKQSRVPSPTELSPFPLDSLLAQRPEVFKVQHRKNS